MGVNRCLGIADGMGVYEEGKGSTTYQIFSFYACVYTKLSRGITEIDGNNMGGVIHRDVTSQRLQVIQRLWD